MKNEDGDSRRRLSIQQQALYRKLLKHRLTIPGFLPTGDGLAGGLWEDVHIFDQDTLEIYAFPTIQSITNPIYHRGATVHSNLERAGLTEKEVHPEEFTPEMMAINKKHASRWKNSVMQSYRLKSGNYRLVFTGIDPDRLVQARESDREIYRAGLHVDKEGGLTFVLNAFCLNLGVIRKHRYFIVELSKRCGKYAGKKKLYIPCRLKGYFPSIRFALSDAQCLRMYKNMRRRKLSASNRVFFSAPKS